MMLTFVWITLRFIHFTSLMLVYGCALYGAWLAPASIRRLITCRFLHLQRHAAAWSVISAAFMLAIQGGLMGGGWPDVFSVPVWGAVLQTRFGAVWIWQIILALVTLAVVVIAPVKMQRRLLILTVAQFILLAGVGHATMRDGVPGTLQQINHALHLFCAAAWFGGLLPVVYCMRMAQGRWRQQAISAMMRFSRYGHFFVAGVLLTGISNTLFITGFTAIWQTAYGQLLLLKCALVVLMVAIALTNRYVLVPRMRQENPRADRWFVRMTQIEWGVGGIVLAIVSLFATLEPF
ncbi:copper homeostasis membrane protein CopD [Salmonella enterica subsp. arizonae str. CFSAN000560]|uniref:Copper resistance protein D n=1 Tax=Salmonella enterica I TaxID=59201 RepID=A0A7T8FKJ4_SALET|nr:membrane protein [Salmonella enterica subsp. arizonae serovar 62:z36:- str. RKS2983]EAO6001192.1 copper homeostasis membrane protein CopD [Salmonella enterica subsp. arizonae serovar 62:z36:-]EAV4981781.1 copper homeostasis membrane protein CopD [Salmonella enterica]ECG1412676.1 copper homeostasis membrane protein CopD [Salmonella enterica subsp. arizonae str. CFSAN000560]ECG8549243.1 copper homeostasis membrane protein CopD [Salmonella enterica subsp. arizonae]QQP09672.1 copper homeostasis